MHTRRPREELDNELSESLNRLPNIENIAPQILIKILEVAQDLRDQNDEIIELLVELNKK